MKNQSLWPDDEAKEKQVQLLAKIMHGNMVRYGRYPDEINFGINGLESIPYFKKPFLEEIYSSLICTSETLKESIKYIHEVAYQDIINAQIFAIDALIVLIEGIGKTHLSDQKKDFVL